MSKQSEQILEEQLIEQLQKSGYGFVAIKDEKDLLANLKAQLEKHNNIQYPFPDSGRFQRPDSGNFLL